MNKTFISTAVIAGLIAGQAHAATKPPPVNAPINFSACANGNLSDGQPVGIGTGNTGTKDSALSFDLLDPSQGNNIWFGGSTGASIDIKLSKTGVTAINLLINTLYGQANIVNGTITILGTPKLKMTVGLKGNATIRDHNNWVWTDTINGTSTQEWWTNNLHPTQNDQSHRADVHVITLGKTQQADTITDIIITAPKNAGANYMEPFLWAVGITYPGASNTVPVSSTCTTS